MDASMHMHMHRPQQIAAFKTRTYDFIMIQLIRSCVTLPNGKETPLLDFLINFLLNSLTCHLHSFLSQTALQLNELLH